MGKLILLMGPTGSGKSTQGDRLAQVLDGVHLSSGHLLREDPRAAAMLTTGNHHVDGRGSIDEVHELVRAAVQ
jgi:adenylate kinase family enzyme